MLLTFRLGDVSEMSLEFFAAMARGGWTLSSVDVRKEWVREILAVGCYYAVGVTT
jgi:hypothetical protein